MQEWLHFRVTLLDRGDLRQATSYIGPIFLPGKMI
jgi:hypothetical protein